MKITTEYVCAATSPSAAAKRFHAWLRQEARERGSDPDRVVLWSPRDGHGDFWSVAWEEGPYEWTMISLGSNLNAGSTGNYSAPGPFAQGLNGRGWFAEAQNHWQLNFIGD